MPHVQFTLSLRNTVHTQMLTCTRTLTLITPRTEFYIHEHLQETELADPQDEVTTGDSLPTRTKSQPYISLFL